MNDRIKIMRKLHATFKKRYELENPHKDLHLLAAAQFGVGSMRELTIEQLNKMVAMVSSADINWKKLEEETGVCVIAEMSQGQQDLVYKLQKELGWSDSYLIEIALRRYGFLHWKYLTGREAWAYVNYLIRRKREKNGKEKF
jgi:hypothetical protein